MGTFEERWAPWAHRAGLVTIGALPQADANLSILRSLPRITEAIRLAERVAALCGDRAFRDPSTGPENWHIYLHDRDDSRWLIPPALIELEVGYAAPVILMPAPAGGELEAPRPRPLLLPGPDRRPGVLMLHEGPANYRIEYGADGRTETSSRTAGDTWTWGFHLEDRPFALDPFVKPAQAPPLSVLCRADLAAAGQEVDVLAHMVCEMDPGAKVRTRVHVPVPMPGGVATAAAVGLQNLRDALWRGRVEVDEGWVVIDAWSGLVHATGATLSSAFAAWREQVGRVQPLPPRPPPSRDGGDEDEDPSMEEREGTVHLSTGTVRVTGPTRPRLSWPEARPENVPAFALPLSPAAAIPAGWERHGFTRAVRLVGEHGTISTAFVSERSDGFVLVGEGAVEAVDPSTIFESLRGLEENQRRDYSGFPAFNPTPAQPARVLRANVWDEVGRAHRIRVAAESWGDRFNVRGFDGDQLRWQAVLARRVEG